MKTTISVPVDIFRGADAVARSAKKSRSEVYTAALREYIARHTPDEVTEAVNRVVEDLGKRADTEDFVSTASRRTLESSEW